MPRRRLLSRALIVGAATMLSIALTAAAAPPAFDGETPPPSSSTTAPPAVLSDALRALADGGIDPSAADAVRAATGVAVNAPGGLEVIDGEVTISVRLRTAEAQRAALDAVSALGEVVAVTRSVPTIVLRTQPSNFEALAAVPGVISVIPAYRPTRAGNLDEDLRPVSDPASAMPSPPAGEANDVTSCREIPVDADPVLHSDEARKAFGVDGTGVTVGIISDSFATAVGVASTAENDVRIGSLPGPGNPCGYTTPVTVVADSPTPGTDEGRAMTQNVHGIAPGATLLFHAAGQTPATFADAIRALRDRGADVIVDDVAFDTEPIYQRGVVATAVADVVDDGTVYLSAIGNEGSIGFFGTISVGQQIGSWESETFRGMPCPQAVLDARKTTGPVDCMNFAPEGETNAMLEVKLGTVGPSTPLLVQWSDPVDGIETTVTPVVLTLNGEAVSSAVQWDMSVPAISAEVSTGAEEDEAKEAYYRVALVRTSPTASDVRTKLIFGGKNSPVRELSYARWPAGVTVGPTAVGHAADPATIGVGSASVFEHEYLDPFSSTGPSTYLFEPVRTDGIPAARLAEPQVLSAPAVVAVDAIRTSFFRPSFAGQFRFSGTSSSAPVAAGVAALALQRSGVGTAPSVIRAALVGGGRPINGPGGYTGPVDANMIGGGMIDAVATLRALPTPSPTPTPEPTPPPTPEPTPEPTPAPEPSPHPTGTPAPVPSSTPASAGQLPRTGSDGPSILVAALLGTGAITAGVLSILRRRRGTRRA